MTIAALDLENQIHPGIASVQALTAAPDAAVTIEELDDLNIVFVGTLRRHAKLLHVSPKLFQLCNQHLVASALSPLLLEAAETQVHHAARCSSSKNEQTLYGLHAPTL